jgi:hypothetical protein
MWISLFGIAAGLAIGLSVAATLMQRGGEEEESSGNW